MSIQDLYREAILDHYRRPRNRGEIPEAQIKFRDTNPLCGDVVEFHIKVDGNNTVQDVRFNGEGCAISQASASMMTQLIKGKSMEWFKQLGKKDVLKMMGIDPGPTRIKCALLPLKIVKAGVYQYMGMQLEKEDYETI